MLVLVDIDGTLSNPTHRLHHITGPKKDWTSFYRECGHDPGYSEMIELVRALHRNGSVVVYVTGRPYLADDDTNIGELTADWLKAVNCPLGTVYMRKPGDHRQDFEVKRELYLEMILPKFGRADLVIEDRDQVVRMWRTLGIRTLQCCEGAY